MTYDREPSNMTEMGPSEYNKRISRENKNSSGSRSIPYNFSKPKKGKALKVSIECTKCCKILNVTEDSIVVICGSCGGVTRVKSRVKEERV